MSETAAVCRCGAPVHATDATRCAKGHPLPGLPGPAYRHGVRAFEARGRETLPADLRVSVDEFKAQVIADRGGMDEMTAIARGYVVRLSEVETVARLLAADLATRGLFTAKGRTRSTLARWLEVLDRWDRLAQRLGMERRARAIDPIEAVRLAVQEANRR